MQKCKGPINHWLQNSTLSTVTKFNIKLRCIWVFTLEIFWFKQKRRLTDLDRRLWISPESYYWDWGSRKAWSLPPELLFPIPNLDESPPASNKYTDFPRRLWCTLPQFLPFLKQHSVWKSQKKSHSTLRAKRATLFEYV